jgi:hypothetical protein
MNDINNLEDFIKHETIVAKDLNVELNGDNLITLETYLTKVYNDLNSSKWDALAMNALDFKPHLLHSELMNMKSYIIQTFNGIDIKDPDEKETVVNDMYTFIPFIKNHHIYIPDSKIEIAMEIDGSIRDKWKSSITIQIFTLINRNMLYFYTILNHLLILPRIFE